MREKTKKTLMKKKVENRFTLQFNSKNTIHMVAIETLNQLGNKKADYIATLIHESQKKVNSLTNDNNTDINAKYQTDEDNTTILSGLNFFS